jgi:hypothetical protein
VNWYVRYKIASFTEKVTCTSWSGNHAAILINGRRYEYSGISGNIVCSRIEHLKKMKNKRLAGEQLSTLIKNLEQFRLQPVNHSASKDG